MSMVIQNQKRKRKDGEQEDIKMSEETKEPTMADMEAEINASMVNYKEGDMVHGVIAGIENYVVYVDLGTYMQGIILPDQLSDDPGFSMLDDLKPGAEIDAIVIRKDDSNGNLVLSLKQANYINAWREIEEALENGTEYTVKIAESVKGGAVAYLNGIRGFIPTSRLSIARLDNEAKEALVGKTVSVIVVEADADRRKLILSAREAEERKAEEERAEKLSEIHTGMVLKGVVESIKPYGCFVDIGNGLSGLVHISQIANKRIKTPGEVVKQGQEVDVKITEIKDGKISLSMKALQDIMEKNETPEKSENEYVSGEEASTSMSALLGEISIDD